MEHDYGSVLAEAERTLNEVDQALARLGAGTYGVCEACGGPIDEIRLASMPTARSCGRHPHLTDRDEETETDTGLGVDPELDAILGFGDGPPPDEADADADTSMEGHL